MAANKLMSVRIEIHGQIDKIVAFQRRTASRMMRDALRQDGIRTWNEYQATGLHISMEEADSWLEKLETGKQVEPPEYHN